MIDVLNTKEELSGYGVTKKPKNFYYIVGKSDVRGYNRVITIYVMAKNGEPYRLGYTHVNTASYNGDTSEAKRVVREVYGYKMDGYTFVDKSINMRELL